ncbi:hypothetical protein PVL29_010220 [Vitis rotundifolia]|uniref:Uncharacterized protein n=1 Tax=Vitis rotundifolia TaxID=103349 RepID=A0AA39DUI7_VITRO|nr:hypothetical protein PVL29_010220 [Vitis rotundifolia]
MFAPSHSTTHNLPLSWSSLHHPLNLHPSIPIFTTVKPIFPANPLHVRQFDNQAPPANHKGTDPKPCKRQTVEDFEHERPIWKEQLSWTIVSLICSKTLSKTSLMVLMGTDAVMGCSVKLHVERIGNKILLCRVPSLVGNVWLIFTKGDLKGISIEDHMFRWIPGNLNRDHLGKHQSGPEKLSLPIVPCASVSLQSLNEIVKLVKQRGAWA